MKMWWFLGVLLFCWPPRRLTRGISHRSLLVLDIDRRNRSWLHVLAAILRVPGLWLDFARGAIGGVLLLDAEKAALLALPGRWAETGGMSSAALFGAILVSIVWRFARFRRSEAPAPIGLVLGSVCVFSDIEVWLIGLVAAAVIAFAFRSLEAFFGALAAALAGLGALLTPGQVAPLIAASIAVIPSLAAFFWRRQLVVAFRRWPGF